MPTPLGIYLHIPFCVSKCPYCDFFSLAGADERKMDDYTGALLAHLGEWKRLLPDYQADTVYFGGGTPSLLGDKRLIRLLKGVMKTCAPGEGAEITFEANPESADANMLKKLRRAGFNRISIGIQSANDQMLRMLGRAHTFERARQAVKDAKAAGFTNISLDMMYGLPGETERDVMETARALTELEPAHLSAYALKLSKESPMGRRNPELPEDDAVADRYLALTDFFESHGYRQYELSNFAHPGMESRHNLKYWKLEPYLGLGPSAHSYLGDRRFSFISDINAYINGVKNGGRLIEYAEDEDGPDRCGEYIMLSLRTTEGIAEKEITGRFHRPFAPFSGMLARCEEHGLAQKTENGYRLTPRGFFVSNSIISDLLNILDKTPPEIPQGYRRPIIKQDK